MASGGDSLSTRQFKPTAQRSIRDGADPIRSIVVTWDDDAPGLPETVHGLADDARALGVRIILVSDNPSAAEAMAEGVERVPTGLSGGSDESTRRRVGLAHTDGDVVVFVTERTVVPTDWTATWFGGTVRD